MTKTDVRILPSRSTYYSGGLFAAGYSISLFPEAGFSVVSFSCRISTSSLDVMLPAEIYLVVDHGIAESKADTALVALWANLAISGLCKRYMFVWHRFTYLGQGWPAFECHHSNLASELQRSSISSATSHDLETTGFSSFKMTTGLLPPYFHQ